MKNKTVQALKFADYALKLQLCNGCDGLTPKHVDNPEVFCAGCYIHKSRKLIAKALGNKCGGECCKW